MSDDNGTGNGTPPVTDPKAGDMTLEQAQAELAEWKQKYGTQTNELGELRKFKEQYSGGENGTAGNNAGDNAPDKVDILFNAHRKTSIDSAMTSFVAETEKHPFYEIIKPDLAKIMTDDPDIKGKLDALDTVSPDVAASATKAVLNEAFNKVLTEQRQKIAEALQAGKVPFAERSGAGGLDSGDDGSFDPNRIFENVMKEIEGNSGI